MDKEFEIKRSLALKNCVYNFEGISNYETHLNIIETIMQSLEQKVYFNYMSKANSIINELVRNALRHCIHDTSVKIIVGVTEEELIIITENQIYIDNKQVLIEKINPINEVVHNKDELKRIYKKIVMEGPMCYDKGGARLGLISIARKTGNKFLYKFIDLEDNKCIFSIITILNKNQFKPE